MYKNVFLSSYCYKGKLSEIEVASGVSQELDNELESVKKVLAELVTSKLITPKLKTMGKKVHYYVELWGDFTAKEIKNVKDFIVVEMPKFKEDDKTFKIQLRKDEQKDETLPTE